MRRAVFDSGVPLGGVEQAAAAICRLSDAHTEAETVHLLADATHHLGADVAVFCSLVRDEPMQQRFMLACDPQWFLEYERSVAVSQDPWIAYASECSEPVCASDMSVTSRAQLDALALARRFGFESTLVVPSPSAGSSGMRLGVLVLGSCKAGFFEGCGRTAVKVMARLLSMAVDEWWLSQTRRELVLRAQLTRVDLDLLRQEHRGYGTKEIARQLRMTKQSIDSRFQRLNARLGVRNRKAAASVAATYGLI